MSGRNAPKRQHKWSLDLTSRYHERQIAHVQPATNLVAPLGYHSTERTFPDVAAKDSNPDLVVKKSWDIALAPLKQIPMNLFIMWMAGNSISIFPIMMVGMMFVRPIQALIPIQQTFKMIEGGQAIVQKFVYLLGNIACLLLAVYKCQVMGLLPTHPSDWLAFVEPQKRMEWSGGGMAL